MLKRNPKLLLAAGVGLTTLMGLGVAWFAWQEPTPLVIRPIQFNRTELAMQAAGQAGADIDSLSLYERHFKPNRDFWQELIAGAQPLPEKQLAGLLVHFSRSGPTQALIDSVLAVWPPTYGFTTPLAEALSRLAAADSAYQIPQIYTYVSGYRPEPDPVFVSDRFLGLGLHYFLREGFPYYPAELPQYVRRRLTPQHLLPTAVQSQAWPYLAPPRPGQQATLLEQMVRTGAALYLTDIALPEVPDSLKIGYTALQTEFAEYHLRALYNDLIKDLYSTDPEVMNRWIDDRPTTPGLSEQSPGRLGTYMGWQMVRAYFKRNPDTRWTAFVGRRDYPEILRQSGFKP